MKDNKVIILTLICTLLGCATVFFGYEYFRSDKCETTNSTNTMLSSNNSAKDNDSSDKKEDTQQEEGSKIVVVSSLSDFEKALKNKDNFFLYLSQTTCGYCIQFEPTLETVFKDYGYKAIKLNINTMKAEDKATLKELVEFRGTPTLIYYKKGVEADRSVGNKSEEVLKTWLNGLK